MSAPSFASGLWFYQWLYSRCVVHQVIFPFSATFLFIVYSKK